MAVYAIDDSSLVAIANAVRAKTNYFGSLTIAEMIEKINSIIKQTNDDLDGLIMRTSETIVSDTARFVAAYAFFSNPSICTVVLTAAELIGDFAFCDCVNLERISTGAKRVGAYAFSGCDELNEILFDDELVEIGVAALSGCKSLTTIDLRNTSVSTILPSVFEQSGVRELWLPENRFCGLADANAFAGTPLGQNGSGGIIHVPMRFRVEYESNRIWSRITGNGTNRIVSY